MAVRLNKRSFDHAVDLIAERRVVLDDRDAWAEHRPSARAHDEFIAANGWAAYARWHLGVDEARPSQTKAHYRYPYGDFQDVHRCATREAESHAGARGYEEIVRAAEFLSGMLERVRLERSPTA